MYKSSMSICMKQVFCRYKSGFIFLVSNHTGTLGSILLAADYVSSGLPLLLQSLSQPGAVLSALDHAHFGSMVFWLFVEYAFLT